MLATQRVSFLVLSLLLTSLFLFLIYREDELPIKHITNNIPYKPFKPSLRSTIVSLFDSIRHPITATYTDASGKQFRLDGNPTWTMPLKNKILLVDIDTREPTNENQIFNPDSVNWEKLEMKGGQLVSNAVMNHYLYAQIHGYDYRFFQASHIPGHYDTWISPHVLHSLLSDNSYQFVVTMDADTTFTHLEVPLEFLFNKWHITSNTSISMPWDTEEISNNVSISRDSKGMQVLNTGFMVVQNLDYTYEMLEAWMDCTSETRYKGCGKWKEEWSHEQRAFSEYIRYDFNPLGNNIVGIPCDDAMGWPGMINDYQDRIISDCNGNFIRHHTLVKEQTKESASSSVMQALAGILQKSLLEQQNTLYINESNSERPEDFDPQEDNEPVRLEGMSADD